MALEDIIKGKIIEAFAPEKVEVINESHLHKGHSGDDGSGETHFKLEIVSKELDSMPKIQSQRAIYGVLEKEMKNKIHALSIQITS